MKSEKQNRREFLQAGAAGFAVFGLMKDLKTENFFSFEPNMELNEITISELQAKMKSGELSAKSLAEKISRKN